MEFKGQDHWRKNRCGYQVSAAEIGNRTESRTLIRVRGFDRNAMKIELDDTLHNINENKKNITRIKQHLQVYGSSYQLTSEQIETYNKLKNEYAQIKEIIKELEYKVRSLNEYLKTPGEGAVIAKTRIYPKVRVEIKNQYEEILKSEPMITYYSKDNELKTM